MNKNEKNILEKELKILKSKTLKLQTKRDALTIIIGTNSDKVRFIENKLREIRQKEQKYEERRKDIHDSLKKYIFDKPDYLIGMKVGACVYLKEYYLKLIEVTSLYDGTKYHNEQFYPIYQMQNVIMQIGYCLDVFTKEFYGKQGNDVLEILHERIKSIKDVNAIWRIAQWWQIGGYELIKKDDAVSIFNEFLVPHTSKLVAYKDGLNQVHNILFKENIW